MVFSFPTLIAVALGGALGATARWLFVLQTAALLGADRTHIATFTVNLLGSFIAGLAIGVLLQTSLQNGTAPSPILQAGLIVGFLGSFTTFSAFSLDVFRLVEQGQTLVAAIYVVASVALALSAAALGVWLVRAALSLVS